MLLKDEDGKLIEPEHEVDVYIKKRLAELDWKNKILVEKSGLSKGQISKLKNGLGEKLTAKAFYSIYTAFSDSCEKARKIVYPSLDMTLHEYKEPERSDFGEYMSMFEVIENSIDIIAEKTGIEIQRLKDLYYRKGALEAYELLLIEKAIGKKPGEAFEEVYRNDSRTKDE